MIYSAFETIIKKEKGLLSSWKTNHNSVELNSSDGVELIGDILGLLNESRSGHQVGWSVDQTTRLSNRVHQVVQKVDVRVRQRLQNKIIIINGGSCIIFFP